MVPMQTLRNEPYSLLLGQKVIALVEANNIVGFNWEPSEENTGDAEIRTEPLAPIYNVEKVDSKTTDT